MSAVMTIRESGRKTERRQQQTAVRFPLLLPGGECVRNDRRSCDRRRTFFIPELLLFRKIHDNRLQQVLAGCPVREFADGEELLAPGQINHNLFLVLSACASVRTARRRRS